MISKPIQKYYTCEGWLRSRCRRPSSCPGLVLKAASFPSPRVKLLFLRKKFNHEGTKFTEKSFVVTKKTFVFSVPLW